MIKCGLPLSIISELVLKMPYVQGTAIGQDLANQTRLAFPIADEALRFLEDQRLVEVASGELVGRVSYRFSLTELGRIRAREVLSNLDMSVRHRCRWSSTSAMSPTGSFGD